MTLELRTNECGTELKHAGYFDDKPALTAELNRRKKAHRKWLADLLYAAEGHMRIANELKKILDANCTSFQHEVIEVPPPPIANERTK